MTPSSSLPGDIVDLETSAESWDRIADAHERAGRLVEAVDALTRSNRACPDAERERRLVRMRHDAFGSLERVGSQQWPVSAPADPLRSSSPLPSVAGEELTSAMLSTGIFRHGALHVRRLLPQHRIDRLVEGIDRAMAAAEAFEAGTPVAETTPWFEPFKPNDAYPVSMKLEVGNRRRWVRDAAGVWTADSPRMMFELADTLEETGLGRLLGEYLGERPAIAVDKCTLRRVGLDTGSDWHQDGAFLGSGPGMRTVNVWMSLSHCGVDAPGLDVVPVRLDSIVETGTDGAEFDWSVGPGAVERVVSAADAPVYRPVFEPGDALIFDELFLHRTAIDDTMSKARYAIETWFFAPSLYPEKYVPLVV